MKKMKKTCKKKGPKKKVLWAKITRMIYVRLGEIKE